MNIDKEQIEEWAKIIGVCVVYLAFLGFLKIYIYYMLFGIEIMDYIKWEEFVLISLRDLVWVILFFVPASFTTFLFFPDKALERLAKDSLKTRTIYLLNMTCWAVISFGFVIQFIAPIFYENYDFFGMMLLKYPRAKSVLGNFKFMKVNVLGKIF